MTLKTRLEYGKEILFRIYLPEASSVSLIGNFNGWNQNMDILKPAGDGYFELRKILPPGEYIYQYSVDGERKMLGKLEIDGRAIPDANHFEIRFHPVYGRSLYLKIES